MYAEVKPHPTKLVIRSTLSDGAREGPFEIPMAREALLAEAERGGFFSYAAGVAWQILTHYRVRGLEAVYKVVEHFGLHYGQIVFITKSLTAKDLGFHKELDKTGRP